MGDVRGRYGGEGGPVCAFLSSWTLTPLASGYQVPTWWWPPTPLGLQLQWEEQPFMEKPRILIPGSWVRSSVGSQHEYSVCMSHCDNFRDQVHPRCTGSWEREKRGEGSPVCEQTRFLHSSPKHLPFTSTQINPSRTASARRGKLVFERLAGSANWSQT